MAEDIANEEGPPPRRLGRSILIGVVLAIPAGAGGFFAVQTGLIPDLRASPEVSEDPLDAGIAFVPIDPIVVSLGGVASGRHLRFQAQLEVPADRAREVSVLLPRVTDVLNGYLRAVDVEDLGTPSSLVYLRAQMLRRVRTVVGDPLINDLLVMEFVLS